MDILSRIQQIHDGCFKLCYEAFGNYPPVAGNVGIFCQSAGEFDYFSQIQKELTYSSENPDQKYFELKVPIQIGNPEVGTSAEYTHLYIRRPSSDSPEAGDIDFVLTQEKYADLKQNLLSGKVILGASIYNRPGWDTIELRNPEISALAYVCTQEMAEKVRIKFD